jgi:hypothetical protein
MNAQNYSVMQIMSLHVALQKNYILHFILPALSCVMYDILQNLDSATNILYIFYFNSVWLYETIYSTGWTQLKLEIYWRIQIVFS